MKLIVAGGRDTILTEDMKSTLMNHLDFTDELVHGGCKGVDLQARDIAEEQGFPTREFKADWSKHGRAAGPIRNREMAEYADAVLLFPGGRGPDSMYDEAVIAGIKIFWHKV